MGEGGHKLLALYDGEPLVRRMARVALASKAGAIHVVTGHRGEEIAAALSGLALDIADNPDHVSGMASSLRVGIGRLSPTATGVLVLLADMPGLRSRHLDLLIDTFRAHDGRAVVRASHGGRRGNPVALPRAAFEEVARLSGDVGARPIVESGKFEVVDVEIGEAAHLDVDTPEAVVAAGGALEGH
jgi:molybdenum cofactor cytidylyltransferase